MAVITIARQFGIDAYRLGNLIAKKLDYKLVEEEIIETIASEAAVSKETVSDIALKAGTEGYLERFQLRHKLGAFRKEYEKGYIQDVLEGKPGYIDGAVYLELLHKVLPAIAERDNAVIVGRGGQYILAGHPSTLHVLLIADLELRIKSVMERYSLDYKQAQLFVEKLGQRRLHLYRYFSNTDYDQPRLYDVIINANRLKLEKVAEMLAQMVSGFSSP